MRRRLHARPKFYTILIVLTALFFIISCGVMQHRLSRASAHADALEQEKLVLALKVRSLNEEIEYVQSDEFILRAAREELKLLMPGEIRYVAQ